MHLTATLSGLVMGLAFAVALPAQNTTPVTADNPFGDPLFDESNKRKSTQEAPEEVETWIDERLNTAKNAGYMKPDERAMIYELNRLRSDPKRYAEFIMPYLEEAKADLAKHGTSQQAYSVTTTYTTDADGKETERNDTTWHSHYEEKLIAINSLLSELKELKPLPILQPHRGIYRATLKHGRDMRDHNYELSHRGSDGSWPRHRIRTFAPDMENGNENIAGSGRGKEALHPPVREIVIQLIIDSGIPGYGHRNNTLNEDWNYAACHRVGWSGSMHYWLQNFGKIKPSLQNIGDR